MAAPVDIANLALTLMGADPITSLDDQVKRARVMKANYDLVRKAELRANNWAFAMVRASLPALVSVPTWGFNLEYQLPVDCLRVVQVSEFWVGLVTDDYIGSDTSTYKIEGRKIRSNLAAPPRSLRLRRDRRLAVRCGILERIRAPSCDRDLSRDHGEQQQKAEHRGRLRRRHRHGEPHECL